MAEEQLILESLDIQNLSAYSAEQGFDFMKETLSVLSGDANLTEAFSPLFHQCIQLFSKELSKIFACVLIPSIVLMLLKLLLPRGISARKTAAFVCRISCIAALTSVFGDLQQAAKNLLQKYIQFSNAITPVMIAAATLSGAETFAASLTPTTALCANMIQNLMGEWGIALASSSCGIAVAGNLSSFISLKRLHTLLKRLLHWGTGGLLAAFMAILSLQGRMSAVRDSATIRTAKYAVENLIPIIGGNVSDALEPLLSAAHIVKNAVGTTGLLLLIYISVLPLAKLICIAMLLHLTAAISEPLGDSALTEFTVQFAVGIEMLLIICVASALLCGLLVGSCMNTTSSMLR